MQKIRIVIIDDHTLLRQTWAFILNSDNHFTVVGESGSAETGVELCRELRPDIVLLDINLPGMNGIEAAPLIRKYSPCTKIIGVSLHTQPVYARKLIQLGGAGYITKNSHRKEMTFALHQVHSGKRYICEEIKNIISQNNLLNKEGQSVNSLSMREMQIVEMVKQGFSSKEIAAEMSISVKTVEVHRYNILKKLNLKNAAQLVAYAGQYQLSLN
jgi:two-component system invasion response regulator UvrY